MDIGEIPIRRIVCSTASNDTAVAGIDIPDEWILLNVTFPVSGIYDQTVTSAGLKDMEGTVQLTLFTDAGGRAAQFSEVEIFGYGLG